MVEYGYFKVHVIISCTNSYNFQFAMMETVVVGITDRFPLLGKHRVKFVAACCLFCFIIGLPFTTKVG